MMDLEGRDLTVMVVMVQADVDLTKMGRADMGQTTMVPEDRDLTVTVLSAPADMDLIRMGPMVEVVRAQIGQVQVMDP